MIFEYTLQLAQEMRLQALVISIVAVLDAEKNLILYLSFRRFFGVADINKNDQSWQYGVERISQYSNDLHLPHYFR